jgi:membrane-associated phospholipid phosphatase
MHDAWVNHQRMSSDISSVGNFWGSGIVEGGIALGQLVFDTDRGIVHTEGLIASTLVTFGSKYGVARPRPDSGTQTSFPSGHTQIAFASATSLTKSYGWGVGSPMIAMGVLTGLSRMADDAHWFSDVVAGATIGIIFGRASFKHHVNIKPMVFAPSQDGFGMLAEWSLD